MTEEKKVEMKEAARNAIKVHVMTGEDVAVEGLGYFKSFAEIPDQAGYYDGLVAEFRDPMAGKGAGTSWFYVEVSGESHLVSASEEYGDEDVVRAINWMKSR